MSLAFSRARRIGSSSRSTPGHLGRVAELLRLQREAAGVAAQIEHRFARAVAGQPAAVLALVAEEARLVSPLEQHAKTGAVFLNRDRRGRLLRLQHAAFEGFLRDRRRPRPHDPGAGAGLSGQPLEQVGASLVHPQAERFGREDVARACRRQFRKGRPLLSGSGDKQSVTSSSLSKSRRRATAAASRSLPESLARRIGPRAQQADGDFGPRIEMAIADDGAAVQTDGHQVAGPRGRVEPVDPLAIEIRVESPPSWRARSAGRRTRRERASAARDGEPESECGRVSGRGRPPGMFVPPEDDRNCRRDMLLLFASKSNCNFIVRCMPAQASRQRQLAVLLFAFPSFARQIENTSTSGLTPDACRGFDRSAVRSLSLGCDLTAIIRQNPVGCGRTGAGFGSGQ